MIEKDKDLTSLTTFGLPVKARYFAEYDSPEKLLRISRTPEYMESEVFHMGGGSNLVMNGYFDGLILHSAIRGIRHYQKDADTVYVIAGAGETWADLVDRTIELGLEGMECMAGIPGEVGAAPVQNVGAYGREAKDVIYNVECFDARTRRVVTIKGEECGFAYRNSRFKNEWKGRYYVLRVSFRLRPGTTARHLSYGALRDLEARLGHTPSIAEVRDEVIRLRNSKLPDPRLIGSAGSFFKNPVVGRYFFNEEVLTKADKVPYYEAGENRVKIPAGWLIEQAGMKGKSVGGAYVYPDNCLVIANKGGATYDDVIRLKQEIVEAVNRKFSIILQPEANFIDSDIRVTVLGTGTSKGIPEATCSCEVCTSADSRDKRQRASVMVSTMGVNILIDASPDFRTQAIRNKLTDIDAVIVTHSHYDHVGGIDDLRPFCVHGSLPIYVREDVNRDLHHRIDYCFREHLYPGVPTFDMKVISDTPFFIKGVKVTPINVMHGKLPIYGYRIGNFAYITDCHTLPEEELDKLRDLDVLIINALRWQPHFSHLSIPEAEALIEKIKPRRAFLTHFCHKAGTHAEMCERLPENIRPAYDGEKIVIKG